MQAIEGGVSVTAEHLVDMLSIYVAGSCDSCNFARIEHVLQRDEEGGLRIFEGRLEVIRRLGVISQPAVEAILIASGVFAHPDPFGIAANTAWRF